MTQEEYKALYKKMLTDDEFLTKIDALKSKEDIYDAYKTYGYTDMNYEDFMKEFTDRINGIITAYKDKAQSTRQLSDEELDEIVGGFDVFKYLSNLAALIPIVGPIATGIAKSVVDMFHENKSTAKGILDVAAGLLGGILDAYIPGMDAIGKFISNSAKFTANTLVDEIK